MRSEKVGHFWESCQLMSEEWRRYALLDIPDSQRNPDNSQSGPDSKTNEPNCWIDKRCVAFRIRSSKVCGEKKAAEQEIPCNSLQKPIIGRALYEHIDWHTCGISKPFSLCLRPRKLYRWTKRSQHPQRHGQRATSMPRGQTTVGQNEFTYVNMVIKNLQSAKFESDVIHLTPYCALWRTSKHSPRRCLATQ